MLTSYNYKGGGVYKTSPEEKLLILNIKSFTKSNPPSDYRQSEKYCFKNHKHSPRAHYSIALDLVES